jgi:hypothetical protein
VREQDIPLYLKPFHPGSVQWWSKICRSKRFGVSPEVSIVFATHSPASPHDHDVLDLLLRSPSPAVSFPKSRIRFSGMILFAGYHMLIPEKKLDNSILFEKGFSEYVRQVKIVWN